MECSAATWNLSRECYGSADCSKEQCDKHNYQNGKGNEVTSDAATSATISAVKLSQQRQTYNEVQA